MITPCGVLYKEISAAANVKRYDEIDVRILSRSHADEKGRSPYDRVLRTGSYRTREIIQKEPRELDVRIFRDAHVACLDIVSFLKKAGMRNRDVFDRFSGDAADAMSESLRIYQFDHYLFRNCMEGLSYNGDPDDLGSVETVMLLFMLTAFHGDPRVSIPQFFQTAEMRAISVNVETGLVVHDAMNAVVGSYPLYGLVRCYPDDRTATQVHPLNPGEGGTLIGRLAMSPHAVNDVGSTVSRQHLLVFRKDATWYARGLGSTNGSRVIHEDGSEDVIEPPSALRAADEPLRNIPLHQNDTLHLGLDTTFRVVSLSRENRGN